ncbi:cyclic nucleotide-binding domain-containing protein, partial [candidate division KSB3 bacterium]|nr:cyclic nucleotide-binding domain-containing protein [candidate division KSB3 bacterium]MBD3327243.1 cyclic nucleotide-binding domain-containing protein [candidate division KSB3 bacterium]
MITISELRKNALFLGVKTSEIRRILPTLRQEYYPRSAVICREGEPGTCIYIILSGQVKLSIIEKTHTKTLTYLNAGDFFGEGAILTNEPRSVTAEAVIDAEILLFNQQTFHDLVERDATIMHNIIRTIDRRIRKRTLGMFHQQVKQSQIIALYSPKKNPWKTFLAVSLAVSLSQQTAQSVVVLDMTMNAPAIPQILNMGELPTIGEDEISEERIKKTLVQHDAGFHLAPMTTTLLKQGKISREQIASTLSVLQTLFQYVIINTPSEISNNTFEALDLSHEVVLLSPVHEEPPTGMFDHQDIITVYYCPEETQETEKRTVAPSSLVLISTQAVEQKFYAHGQIPVHKDSHDTTSAAIHKIARHIANLRIGLALGGIAARGLSHIGVLKVLENNNIPIDMISASNTGAVIGAMYAKGMSLAEIEQIVLDLEQHLPLFSARDFNPFSGGLLKNRRLLALIAEFLPEHLTFHDLTIPLRMITMALDTGKEVALHTGSLLKGIEASIAMPGIFPPVHYQETFLVDGSTINPVPISDLVEMQADILVGVNSFAPLTPSYTPPPKDYH